MLTEKYRHSVGLHCRFQVLKFRFTLTYACDVAYGVGLLVTFVALAIMGSGQPALLYIVPFTLGTTVVIGWLRKELRQLWTGQPVSQDDQLNFLSLSTLVTQQ